MQRKAVRLALPGIAMATALVAGCTGGSGSGDRDGDAKGGLSAPAPAPPGKYRSLPMPCKAVDGKRLKAMLPVDSALTSEQKDQLYAGTADTSYDGDRRVGCRWKAQDAEGTETTRLLYVGFERVVSYDRAADSDDDKAHQVYERQLVGAGLPAVTTATSPPPAPPNPSAPSTTAPGSPGAQAPSTAGGTPSPGTPRARAPPPRPPSPPPPQAPASWTASATRRSWTTGSARPAPPPSPGRCALCSVPRTSS
ncbi:DUF3558 domain-containing protein [Streptomyces venezuelae]|uniref:DUF3558 domain-containing protein n=1 Tax=Streptomyces venezuelae TaxID=54571 RepID=UPI001CC22E12|nr:DUF3558 domain-containing protein [Streptomyces venezuelae]